MKVRGFTLIELILVIVVLGILSIVAAPKFISLSADAKIASLEALKGQMQSTIDLVKVKARVSGLKPVSSNPGGSAQTGFIFDFGYGAAEVDWRNLCPKYKQN